MVPKTTSFAHQFGLIICSLCNLTTHLCLSLLPIEEEFELQFSEDDEGNNNDGTRSFIQPSESARKAVSSSKSKSKHHSNQGRPSQIQTSRSKKQQIRAPDSASDASDSEQGRVPLSDKSNFGTMGPQRASKRKTPSTVLEPNATAKAAKRMTKSQYEKEIQALKAELLTKDATIKTSVSELAQSAKKHEQSETCLLSTSPIPRD